LTADYAGIRVDPRYSEARLGLPETKGAPPEAILIRQRRENQVPKMSARRAAAIAQERSGGDFSASTWLKIEGGDYRGPADRVAIMADVVGVTPDELDQKGRPDAARLLREHVRRRAEAEPALAGLDRETTSESVLQLLLQGLDEIRREKRLNPEQKQRLEAALLESTLNAIKGQMDQIRTVIDIAKEGGKQG
jgi:hypothetical protein